MNIPHIVRIAESIARKAHEKQKRRDGSPYIHHPAEVAYKLEWSSEEVRATAWLHDVLEDSELTAGHLLEAGIPPRVVEAVQLLTHQPGQSYDCYVSEIRKNPIASKVKIADMIHNLSDEPTPRQVVKYAKGLLILMEDKV